jgi:hypothetical protein
MKMIPCRIFNPDVREPADFRLARERNRNGLNKNPAFRQANWR